MAIENFGTESNITLRFKHSRITILLLSEQLTPFTTLKTELLDILRERYPLGIPKSSKAPTSLVDDSPETKYTLIPESIEDVILGVPNDQSDLSKGFRELEMNGGGGIMDSPKGLGIVDANVVVFRFQGTEDIDVEDYDGGFEVQWSTYEDIYGDQRGDDGKSLEEDDGEDAVIYSNPVGGDEDEDEDPISGRRGRA